MTAKHTPGPWTVVGKTRDAVRGPAGNMVAECIGYSDKATDPIQRAYGGRESNARLIAASPDMFNALARISDRLEAWAEAHEHLSTVSRSESEIESHANRAANYRELIRIARDSMPKS